MSSLPPICMIRLHNRQAPQLSAFEVQFKARKQIPLPTGCGCNSLASRPSTRSPSLLQANDSDSLNGKYITFSSSGLFARVANLLFEISFPFRFSCSSRDRQHILELTLRNIERDAIDTHNHSVERESSLEISTSRIIHNFLRSRIFLLMPLSCPGSCKIEATSEKAKSCLHSRREGAS